MSSVYSEHYSDCVEHYSDCVEPYGNRVDRYGDCVERYGNCVECYGNCVECYDEFIDRYGDFIERYNDSVERYDDSVEGYGDFIKRSGDSVELSVNHSAGPHGLAHPSGHVTTGSHASLVPMGVLTRRFSFLSNSASIYIALDPICTAERLNLERQAEAFVNSVQHDSMCGTDRADARGAAQCAIFHYIGARSIDGASSAIR